MPDARDSTPTGGPLDASGLDSPHRPERHEEFLEGSRETLASLPGDVPGAMPENRAQRPDRIVPPERAGAEERGRLGTLAENVRDAVGSRAAEARARFRTLGENVRHRFKGQP